jgi:hypothetical protein
VAFVIGGTFVGCVLGAIVGGASQKIGPVEVEALPMCTSSSGDKSPLQIQFSIGF